VICGSGARATRHGTRHGAHFHFPIRHGAGTVMPRLDTLSTLLIASHACSPMGVKATPGQYFFYPGSEHTRRHPLRHVGPYNSRHGGTSPWVVDSIARVWSPRARVTGMASTQGVLIEPCHVHLGPFLFPFLFLFLFLFFPSFFPFFWGGFFGWTQSPWECRPRFIVSARTLTRRAACCKPKVIAARVLPLPIGRDGPVSNARIIPKWKSTVYSGYVIYMLIGLVSASRQVLGPGTRMLRQIGSRASPKPPKSRSAQGCTRSQYTALV
jgi:hypothetical protein